MRCAVNYVMAAGCGYDLHLQHSPLNLKLVALARIKNCYMQKTPLQEMYMSPVQASNRSITCNTSTNNLVNNFLRLVIPSGEVNYSAWRVLLKNAMPLRV